MNLPLLRRMSVLLARAGLASLPVLAQEKVLRPSQITEQAVIDALAGPEGDRPGPGAEASIEESFSRGFGPMRPPGSPGAVRRPGKASMLLTFLTDSADLLPQTRSVLDVVAGALKSDRLSGQRFVIEGHADPRGGEEHNRKLSQDRAESVTRYLVSRHGLTADRLKPVGKGASELLNTKQPLAPENRRVSIVVQP